MSKPRKILPLTISLGSETFVSVKSAIFHPKARETIQEFSNEVKLELGKLIFDLQKGRTLSMPMSRPIKSVASGVSELRVRDRDGIYRVFYFTKLTDKVLVFHAFTKKTQETPKHEILLGRERLKELLDEKKQ